jgi:hypothetical protein
MQQSLFEFSIEKEVVLADVRFPLKYRVKDHIGKIIWDSIL